MDLCVQCKGCRRECPTGVDVSRMKVEFRHHWQQRHGLTLRERLVAFLPRYARTASRLRWPLAAGLALRRALPPVAWLVERWLGLSAKRSLPSWHADAFMPDARAVAARASAPRAGDGREVVLWVDTFDNWYEPQNLRAARRVLEAAGYHVHLPVPAAGDAEPARPLCCGRTFLAAGLVEEARAEARRTLAGLAPHIERGVPVVGLEPSCLLSMRDEFLALGLG
jgi:Fe-S oxidoreductase